MWLKDKSIVWDSFIYNNKLFEGDVDVWGEDWIRVIWSVIEEIYSSSENVHAIKIIGRKEQESKFESSF